MEKIEEKLTELGKKEVDVERKFNRDYALTFLSGIPIVFASTTFYPPSIGLLAIPGLQLLRSYKESKDFEKEKRKVFVEILRKLKKEDAIRMFKQSAKDLLKESEEFHKKFMKYEDYLPEEDWKILVDFAKVCTDLLEDALLKLREVIGE